MPLLVVSSPKGGVGKTTLTANLAVALARRGHPVTAVDFDPQDALRYHLGFEETAPDGVGRLLARGGDWREALIASESGVRLVPYGEAGLDEIVRAEAAVTPDLLSRRFTELAPGRDDVVIADTPPGQNRFIAALDQVADVGLVVFLADAGSMALLPRYEGGLFLRAWAPGEPRRFGVLNQVDPRRRLSRDISEFVEERQKDRFIGTVRYDEAMAEALAHGTTLIERTGTVAGATADIGSIADRLGDLLVGEAIV